MTTSQKLQHEEDSKPVQYGSENLAEEYCPWAKLFSMAESQHLPEHQEWDHKIHLTGDYKPIKQKMYTKEQKELELEKEFVEVNLAKGYIRPSKSEST